MAQGLTGTHGPPGTGSVISVGGGIGLTATPADPIIVSGSIDLDFNSLTTEPAPASGDIFAFLDVSVGVTPAATRKATLANLATAIGPLLPATLDTNARVAVRKNSGATVGTRRRINLIEGTNVTLTVADDGANEEVDVTIASSGGGGGGSVTSVAGGVGITNTPEPVTTTGTVDLDINSLTTEPVPVTGDLFAFVDVSVGTSPSAQRKATLGNIATALGPIITISNITQITTRLHSSLQSLSADDHTQYALLAGRAGGQSLIGGTGGGETLDLRGNTGSTGRIQIGQTNAYAVNQSGLGWQDGSSNVCSINAPVLYGTNAGFAYDWPVDKPTASGQALVSTTLGVMSWATVSASPLTTKGDIWGFSTVDARVPVGANGTALFADSTQTPGVIWRAVTGTDVTGAALTKTDDTNVTLTLGGTPATALLRAASITVGWTGLLGVARGGTGANLSATGGTSQVLKQTSVGGTITVGQLSVTDISGGATLSRVNDTNVTLTLGGSPTTALLAATSLTLGWTGQLGVSRGGTGADLSATGGTSQVLKQTSVGGTVTVGQLAFTDISGSVTDAQVPDTITIANLTQVTTRNHSDLQGLTVGDDHTQYTLKAGRTGTTNNTTLSTSGDGTLAGSTITAMDLVLRPNTADLTTGEVQPEGVVHFWPSFPTTPAASTTYNLAKFNNTITHTNANSLLQFIDISPVLTRSTSASIDYRILYAHGSITNTIAPSAGGYNVRLFDNEITFQSATNAAPPYMPDTLWDGAIMQMTANAGTESTWVAVTVVSEHAFQANGGNYTLSGNTFGAGHPNEAGMLWQPAYLAAGTSVLTVSSALAAIYCLPPTMSKAAGATMTLTGGRPCGMYLEDLLNTTPAFPKASTIYSLGTAVSMVHAGPARFGDTTDPTEKLEVAGNEILTGNLTVQGNTHNFGTAGTTCTVKIGQGVAGADVGTLVLNGGSGGAAGTLKFQSSSADSFVLRSTTAGLGQFAAVGAIYQFYNDATFTTNGFALNTGKVSRYQNIATVSAGMPAEYATVDLTAQGALIAATTLYAVPAAGAGMYRISWYAKVTRAATTSSVLAAPTFTWTDSTDSVAQSAQSGAFSGGGTPAAGTVIVPATGNTGNSTTTVIYGSVVVWAALSTNIQYSMPYTSSGATTMQYELHIKLEAL